MVDFDIEAVKKRDNSNPVYYVQYAHARVCSILRRAADVTPEQADEMGMKAVAAKAIGENVDYSLLTDPTELALSRKLNELTRPDRQLRSRPRPVPFDALCRGARRRLPQLLCCLPGAAERGPSPSTPSFRAPVWPLATPSA